jgi:murein DD-endopeptidase MepM/ murein hydrolase activator NlpD
MERRFYTFLIFPGAHGKLRKVQVPFYALHVVASLAVIGMVTLGALASSYARMLLKVSNYNHVRNEREALKTQFRSLESVMTQTNVKLDSLQSLAAEVALTYGFGEAQRPRFPHALLSLATQTNSNLESSYQVSLYAFNLMKQMSANPLGDTARGLIPEPSLDHLTIPSLWPVRGQISSGFGQRMDPFVGESTTHTGVDISAPRGTSVEATADGIVTEAERDGGYGNDVLIDHGFGISTRYCHLSHIYVVVGQEVKSGQTIGAVGSTGRSTGPHLHYEVRVHHLPVNPSKYLRG